MGTFPPIFSAMESLVSKSQAHPAAFSPVQEGCTKGGFLSSTQPLIFSKPVEAA